MTDATGDRWVKCEELRFRGDGACFAWRKATVDEVVEHFKKQIIMGYICTRCGGTNVACEAIVNPYMPEKERFTLTLTDEERLLVEERIKAGYYFAENIEKRREEDHKAEMLKKRAEICERYDKRIRQAEAEKKDMERLNFETLFRVVRWDYNRCFKDESLDKNLFMEKYGKVMGEHYYNKFVHEFNGNILKMIGYFRGSEKEGQVFCDMITECIEKYEQRGLYSRGKLNN